MRATDRPGQLIVAVSPGQTDGELVEASASITNALRQRGVSAVARLLAQSFDPLTALTTPADRLSQLLGEPATTICPPKHWYDVDGPVAFAAAALGRPPFTLNDLIADTHFHPSTSVGILIAPHGPAAPLATDGDVIALCRRLQPDLVVIVTTSDPRMVNFSSLAAAAVAPAPVLVAVVDQADGEPGSDQAVSWLRQRFDTVTGIDAVVGRLTAPRAASA